jgi:hypothetical protein
MEKAEDAFHKNREPGDEIDNPISPVLIKLHLIRKNRR